MGIEEGGPSAEEIFRNQQTRAESDQALVDKGAKVILKGNNQVEIAPTDDQIDRARGEMAREKVPEGVKEFEERLDKLEAIYYKIYPNSEYGLDDESEVAQALRQGDFTSAEAKLIELRGMVEQNLVSQEKALSEARIALGQL